MTKARLARKLGLFSATMAVIGGIVGSGIFINPYLVAQRVHTVPLILGAWLAGGIVALLGGFIYAELAARAPVVGGQYAYLRDALHPAVAFVYGWVLLLVIQTGGMAAVAVTFARYFLELTPLHVPDSAVAVSALALLTLINTLGVRAGSGVQSAMTLTAVGAIAILELLSFAHSGSTARSPAIVEPFSPLAFGSAMTPVLFAYGGWQTSSFLAGEIREPARTLPRALLLGVVAVIIVYSSINFVYLRELGTAGLAATATPASAVMRKLLGPNGGRFIAAAISVSAFGFLAQSMLTAPRVYFAMAEDRVFFRSVGWLHPRTHVPVVAIALQGVCAIAIALTGTYAQVVNYVVAMDSIFFGLTALCLFIFRKRAAVAAVACRSPDSHPPAVGERGGNLRKSHSAAAGDRGYRVPLHPWTTLLFILAEWLVVASTFAHDPRRSCIGLAIALAGLPVYFAWRRAAS